MISQVMNNCPFVLDQTEWHAVEKFEGEPGGFKKVKSINNVFVKFTAYHPILQSRHTKFADVAIIAFTSDFEHRRYLTSKEHEMIINESGVLSTVSSLFEKYVSIKYADQISCKLDFTKNPERPSVKIDYTHAKYPLFNKKDQDRAKNTQLYLNHILNKKPANTINIYSTQPVYVPIRINDIRFSIDKSESLDKELFEIETLIKHTAKNIEISIALFKDSWEERRAYHGFSAILMIFDKVELYRFQWKWELDAAFQWPLELPRTMGLDFVSQPPRITLLKQEGWEERTSVSIFHVYETIEKRQEEIVVEEKSEQTSEKSTRQEVTELSEFICQHELASEKRSLAVEALKNNGKSFGQIRSLDLSAKGLREIPESIELLTDLVYLDLSANNFDKIPNEIYKLSSLKVLIMKNNEITVLETDILDKLKLNKLDIRENPILQVSSKFETILNGLPSFHSVWVD